jgi:hypothetical protein
MRAKWVAVLALTAMLAGCGTGASRPAARTNGTAVVIRAPVGSRAAALTLARQLLSGLVLPPGSRAVHPSPVPPPLRLPAGGDVVSSYTVELHRFVLVREPAATVHSFLLGHVPAGMSWASAGLAEGTTNTVTVLSVGYRPRSLAPGLTNAELDTAALPAAGDDTLVRADASVSWFPPRSAAEYLNAAGFRSVTVIVTVTPRPRTVTRTFTSPAVIGRLVALADSLPATPYPDVAAMRCLGAATVYRLDFTPGVVVGAGECGGSDAITVNGKQQPRLWDPDALTAAARQLLHLPTSWSAIDGAVLVVRPGRCPAPSWMTSADRRSGRARIP